MIFIEIYFQYDQNFYIAKLSNFHRIKAAFVVLNYKLELLRKNKNEFQYFNPIFGQISPKKKGWREEEGQEWHVLQRKIRIMALKQAN